MIQDGVLTAQPIIQAPGTLTVRYMPPISLACESLRTKISILQQELNGASTEERQEISKQVSRQRSKCKHLAASVLSRKFLQAAGLPQAEPEACPVAASDGERESLEALARKRTASQSPVRFQSKATMPTISSRPALCDSWVHRGSPPALWAWPVARPSPSGPLGRQRSPALKGVLDRFCEAAWPVRGRIGEGTSGVTGTVPDVTSRSRSDRSGSAWKSPSDRNAVLDARG